MFQVNNLKHDGRAFERFVNDFCVCFNACGGHAVNTFYPVDFHISTNNFSMWLEVKEMHSATCHIFSLKYYDKDPHFRKQINFLYKMYLAGHSAVFAIWLPHWRELRARAPFVFINAAYLYKVATDPNYNAKQISIRDDGAHPFNFYSLLQKAPNFERFFKNIPIDRRPYIYHSFPGISNYLNPNYSAWKKGGNK